jgi:ATP-dependent Clp endopeptidase proteolytic subunit ClpP
MLPDCDRPHEDEYVRVQGSDVYFHCEVCEATVLELILKLKKLENELLHKYLDLGIRRRPEIRIFIRSDGGDIHSGLSAMDTIQNMDRVKVKTIADGICASAATFILLGGHRRYMTPNSYIMIHQLNMDGTWGKFEDFKDQLANLQQFMDRFRKIYLEETKIPSEKLEEILKRDVYMDTKKCLEWEIVDHMWA